jgi:hypothetical protein
VSIKDKIDPQILLRLEAKLDRVLENFDDLWRREWFSRARRRGAVALISNISTRLLAGKFPRTSSMTTARKEPGRSGNSPTTPRKETLGQVHAGGFLHHLILVNEDGSRVAPSQLTANRFWSPKNA